MNTTGRGKAWKRVIGAAALGLSTSIVMVWVIASQSPQPWGFHTINLHAPDGSRLVTYNWCENSSVLIRKVEIAGERIMPTAAELSAAVQDQFETADKKYVGPNETLATAYVPAFLRDVSQGVPNVREVELRAFGWPMRCLSMHIVRASLPTGTVWMGGVLPHGVYDNDPRSGMTAFPVTPIWPGLAVNSAMFGAVWWGVLWTVGEVRRRRRAGKGQCPACDYDLGGRLDDGCPECGWNRPNVV